MSNRQSNRIHYYYIIDVQGNKIEKYRYEVAALDGLAKLKMNLSFEDNNLFKEKRLNFNN